MKNIDNIISEELKKMTSLFSYQPGKVISEQETPIQKIARNLITATCRPGTDLNGLVNWIKQIKDINTYNQLNNYLKVNVNNGGCYENIQSMINGEIDTRDIKEMKDIMSHLKSIGIQSSADIASDGSFLNKNTFKIGTQSPKTLQPDSGARIKNITSSFCRVQNGVINWPGSAVDKMKWTDYIAKYKPTQQELTSARTSCPKNIVGGDEVNQQQQRRIANQKALVTATQQIQTSIGSKPTGQLSDVELQTILNRL